ncbi:hypothetical protein ZWY2020_035699 [Hordeum vulgare]|nr:hypothetical protein ZWY2020_035699 [Hordeum vulgare]
MPPIYVLQKIIPEPSVDLEARTSPERADSDHGSIVLMACPRQPPGKGGRKISTSAADQRAPDYAKKGKAIGKDAPAKKAGVKRPKKRTIHLVGTKTSMFEDPEEVPAEIQVPPKKKKLMGDAMKSARKPVAKAKKVVASRKTTKDIPVAPKSKGPASSAHVAEEEQDENALVLRKLIPYVPLHNDSHPVAEHMKKRKDAGLRKWRAADPYAIIRRIVVDPRFHTKEQRDFYETVLYDKSPGVSDMRTAADQKRSCGYAPYIQMPINAKLGNHVYQLDRPHLPLQPEFEDNEVVMDDNDPNSAAARMAAEAEVARNRPPPVPWLRTQVEQMAFLVSNVQGMEKNIQEIMQNQKSLERVVETKLHTMDLKVTELTTIVR